MIYFTKHAKDKFDVLKRHGVHLTETQITETVLHPGLVDTSRLPLLIAQSTLDDQHVLRVVYKQEKEIIKVITFYPGRKSQYGK